MKLKFRGRTKQRKKNRWCKFYTSQPPACTQLNKSSAMRHSPSWALRCNNSAERLLLALPGHCRTEEGIKTWCESACLLSIFLQINISSVLLCNIWPTVTNYLIRNYFGQSVLWLVILRQIHQLFMKGLIHFTLPTYGELLTETDYYFKLILTN